MATTPRGDSASGSASGSGTGSNSATGSHTGTADGGDLPAAGRQVMATLIGMAQSRLELATVELEEERLRLARLCIACTATLFFGFLCTALLALGLVLWCEPVNRLLMLAGLSGAAVVATGLGAWWWRRLMANKPTLLHATVDALRKDREACLGSLAS